MISVIIPTRNAEGHIRRLLDSLKGQSAPSETVVIDSSSSDNTVSIAESLGAKTKIIVRNLFGHGIFYLMSTGCCPNRNLCFDRLSMTKKS